MRICNRGENRAKSLQKYLSNSFRSYVRRNTPLLGITVLSHARQAHPTQVNVYARYSSSLERCFGVAGAGRPGVIAADAGLRRHARTVSRGPYAGAALAWDCRAPGPARHDALGPSGRGDRPFCTGTVIPAFLAACSRNMGFAWAGASHVRRRLYLLQPCAGAAGCVRPGGDEAPTNGAG